MIKDVSVLGFRNFKRKRFIFSPKTTIIVGPNASGKTNILEALYLLSTGKSFKARLTEEMINYDKEIARAKAQVVSGINPEAVLTRGEINLGTTRQEKVPKKRLLLNGIGKRMFNFAGQFRTVLFGPWDLELVTESPSIRRNFLDKVISQVDREYARAILSYEKGLRRRNRILYRIREEGLSRSNLLFWSKLLIKNGDYVSRRRQDFIEFINETPSLNEQEFKVDYEKSAISAGRLEQYRSEEVAAATTLVGPHRDDIVIRIKSSNSGYKNWRDLARYGSRGEQRMGVLWLKLAELAFIKTETGENPTLLLDDIFSELDKEHRKVVMKVVNNQQTIITTATVHFIKGYLKQFDRINLD